MAAILALNLERGAAAAAVIGETGMDAEVFGKAQARERFLGHGDEQAIDILGRESDLRQRPHAGQRGEIEESVARGLTDAKSRGADDGAYRVEKRRS